PALRGGGQVPPAEVRVVDRAGVRGTEDDGVHLAARRAQVSHPLVAGNHRDRHRRVDLPVADVPEEGRGRTQRGLMGWGNPSETMLRRVWNSIMSLHRMVRYRRVSLTLMVEKQSAVRGNGLPRRRPG